MCTNFKKEWTLVYTSCINYFILNFLYNEYSAASPGHEPLGSFRIWSYQVDNIVKYKINWWLNQNEPSLCRLNNDRDKSL